MSDLLEMRGIVKRFGAVQALRGVDFAVSSREVCVLLGENGAGKSTLLKTLTGVHAPDGGQILWQGQAVTVDSPRRAQALGIRMVYQELNLAPHLSVAANIFLGAESVRGGLLDHRAMRERARALLESYGLALDPDTLVGALSPAQRQLVEICKALAADARLLLLDEPTSSLGEREIADLFRTLRGLKEKGLGIVYVSHRLEECFAIGDRIVVLRDGEKVYESPIPETDTATVVRAMIGRDLADFYPREDLAKGAVKLEVEIQGLGGGVSPLPRRGRGEQLSEAGMASHGAADGLAAKLPSPAAGEGANTPAVSFTARAGEIVGIAGLMGSGRTELLTALFGLRSDVVGQIKVEGRNVPLGRGPRAAIRRGLGLLTEDRKRTGLALRLPVRHNITLAALGRLAPGPLLPGGRERAAARTLVEKLAIRTSSTETPVGNLSGGNQQKAVIARWLFAGSTVLLFDEPTRGIDVGSKVEVYRLMNDLTRDGAVILMVSSDLPELLGMSDRVLVLHRGRQVADLPKAEATQERVLHLAMTGRDIEGNAR